MATFEESLRDGIRNAYCQVLSTAENFWEQNIPSIGVVPNPGLGAARFAQRLFCNREPPAIPTAPFTGGQCPTTYTVTIQSFIYFTATGQAANNQPVIDTVPNIQGPIQGAYYRVIDGGQTGQVYLVHNGGETVFRTYSPAFTANGLQFGYAKINSISRDDGQPDNCGNPDSPINPPSNNYNVRNVNITYVDASGNNITIPVGIVFAPVAIGNNNRILIPFDVDVPIDFDLTIEGTLSIPDGQINFNFGEGRDYPGIDPCEYPDSDIDDDLPDVPDDVPVPVPPDDPDEIPRVIRGAIITTTSIGNNTSTYFQNSIPDLYLPRLGNVQFLVEIDGKIAWTDTIEVRNRRQLVLCPWEGGAIAVDGAPRPGVSWEITPVYELSSSPVYVRPFTNP